MTSDEFDIVYDAALDILDDDGRAVVMFFPREDGVRVLHARVPITQLYRAYDPEEAGRMEFLAETMVDGSIVVDEVMRAEASDE
jgi:hypothetical protein